MFEDPIGDLSPRDDVEDSDYSDKPSDASQGSFAIEARFSQTLVYLPLSEKESDGDQYQSGKEDQREL